MDEPLVSVRGEAVREVEPETAQLTVAVGARDKHREETLRRVDERSAAVLALLESYGVDRVETTSVRIGPEFKDGKPNERIAGYSAVVRHAVTVTDFTTLGDLVARLAELELVDVAGPWWRLRPDSPTYKTARMAAARDAVERGREYAEALGSHLTTVVEIADTGLLTQPADGGGDVWSDGPPRPMAAAPAAMRAMSAGAPARPVTLDLEPVRQVVRASVEARFRMAAPPAGTL